jgi:hypothetical protein
MPLRRIVFDAVVVGLVVAMVIARLRSASGPTRVLKPVEERSPWRDLRERLLNLHRDEPGVRAVAVAFALAIAGAAWIIGSGNLFPRVQFLAPTAQAAEPVTASTGVLIASAVCSVMAWTLLITGASFSKLCTCPGPT